MSRKVKQARTAAMASSRGSAFKARVALAAIKGDKTLGELASQFGVHATQISTWKQRLLEGVPDLFADRRRKPRAEESHQEELFEQIGRLKMEVEWLKKNRPSSVDGRRSWIEPGGSAFSIRRQCELAGLARGSWYYQPVGESAANLALMREIDVLYTRRPYFGSRRLADELAVNRKRVQRLMRLMGLEAIYPKPRTTLRCPEHKIYPYLLRNVAVVRPNQVWSTQVASARSVR